MGMDLLSIPDIAAELHISEATAARWCRLGILPAQKVGKQYRIRRADLEAWYDANQHPTKPQG